MGSVFYRDPGHNYPVAVRGKGVYLYVANGKEYLDGSGGPVKVIACIENEAVMRFSKSLN